MAAKKLEILRDGSRVELRLARPEVHNAFDAALIKDLHAALKKLSADRRLRVLVLAGEGTNFCAGADLNWMKASIRYTRSRNEQDAMRMHRMLQALYEFPRPTVARVHGGVFGGGVGLVACCDVAVAEVGALLSLSETRLGILPAVISPFVIRKIGVANFRAYGLSAKRMSAVEAQRIGLLQDVVPPDDLDPAVDRWCTLLRNSGPEAMAALKKLTVEVESLSPARAAVKTTRAIARARAGKEGQEGMKAFLAKRKPSWRPRD